MSVHAALTVAYRRAPRQPLPEDGLAVLSDFHAGRRDRADDHLQSEPATCAALTHYHEEGWTVALLGDTLELWENDPAPVRHAYREELAIVEQLRQDGRLHLFYGNHDLQLRRTGAAEAIRYEHEGRTLFLIHGHQGTRDSDGWRATMSRLAVRYAWRGLQVRADVGVRPSNDHALRGSHDRVMYDWARTHPERPLLVVGHTHEPVFWDSLPGVNGGGRLPDGPVRDAFAAAHRRGYRPPFTMNVPCYFNAGCWCYSDGDGTCLEFTSAEARLMHWGRDTGRRSLLASASMQTILERTAGAIQ
jgi:predicted phosphodiesterase